MLELASVSAGEISLLLLGVIATTHCRSRGWFLAMLRFWLARVGHRH